MSENILEMSQEGLGKVEIAPEVIEVIAGIASNEVEGLAQMRGNFAAGVAERFGLKNHGKGVKVDLTDDGIVIDIYCVVQFGISIPTVAGKVQENIRQSLKNMTALDTKEINVHVVGVQFETSSEEDKEEE
ncbi:Asp23/Gls24 family envelope stress response protein [Bacillus carboniphilus]|uniref:Asp23/Gls24 family envelope stress response protein n=1 Tax=Bacillus carboniphilus TaxID=86663 RepID=A0ABY9JWY1_9BACI|nr:Asp23/Gls24 family envelope stress response protein [Bacillus carboniphilus]WLR43884.1 Asp23/Gls24 family envelope stress response protein [Bacillus carboniphilus]